MPKWLSDPWIVTIGGTVIAAAIIAIVPHLRRLIARLALAARTKLRALGAWMKPSGLNRTNSSTDAELPPFIISPRWEIRGRPEDSRIHGIQNVGGTALHVRVRPESDETAVEGDLDNARVEKGGRIVFAVLNIDREMADTWFMIDCLDESGVRQPTARVRIPGLISKML